MKVTYEMLDNAILEAIKGGRTTFVELLGVEEVRQTSNNSGRHRDNVLNGRLQALRKKGKIEFGGGHWGLAQPRFAEEQA